LCRLTAVRSHVPLRKNERNEIKVQGPEDEPRVTMMAEFTCAVTGTVHELEDAMNLFEKFVNAYVKGCAKGGSQASHARAVFRPMTREEALVLTPRKFHWAPDGDRVCDTAYVSPKQLTDDPSKVTCKLCLRWMEANDVRVEAGRGKAKGREERPRAGEAEAGTGQEGH
jgi:hypothetical protein